MLTQVKVMTARTLEGCASIAVSQVFSVLSFRRPAGSGARFRSREELGGTLLCIVERLLRTPGYLQAVTNVAGGPVSQRLLGALAHW